MVNINGYYMVNDNNHLAGGFSPTPLKNDGVSSSVGMMKFPIYIYIWKIIHSCSKPPTSDNKNMSKQKHNNGVQQNAG